MKVPFFVIVCLIVAGVPAKPPITEGETDPVMLDLDPYMIEALRGDPKADKNIPQGRFGSEGGLRELLGEEAFVELVKKHDLFLFNGPMVGDMTPTSAKIWVRTAGEAYVQVEIDGRKTVAIKTTAESDFTGVVTLDGLKPFTEYTYSIILAGEKISDPSFKLKTFPKPGSKEQYAFAFGSGARYVPTNEGIWQTMAETEPLAYLGMGDNVYIDATHRRDVQRLHYYRRMLRKEYREFIAQTAIYSVWDDHDMAMNDDAGGPGLSRNWKRPNFEVFKQNWNNPYYGQEPEVPGTWHNFTMGDVEIFMLDGRFYRSDVKDKSDTTKTMLGPEQKEWLLQSLEKSTAKFKVLASGTMWHDKADKGGKDSWAGPRFKAERDEIFDFINEKQIDGVILICGDRHRADLWKTERTNGYPLYEMVSAKVTNQHTHKTREEAEWSVNEGNFWGEVSFDFTKSDPTVTFASINQDAEVMKSSTFKLSELSH